MEIATAIDKFVKWSNLKELADTTLVRYEQRLQHWARRLPADIVHIEQVDHDLLLEYCAARQQECASKTVRNETCLLKSFFKYLYQARYMEYNPATLLPLPKWRCPETEFLTLEEIAQLIAIARAPLVQSKINLWNVYRNVAIIFMLVDTGLRRAELCSIRRADVNLAAHAVHVRHGKGDQEGYVVLSPETEEVLQEHWHRQTRGEYCIENYNGTPIKPKALTNLCARLGKRLGRHIHPHMLRHSCATAMVNNGVHLKIVQEQLRHKSIITTMRYAHADLTMRVENHAVFGK